MPFRCAKHSDQGLGPIEAKMLSQMRSDHAISRSFRLRIIDEQSEEMRAYTLTFVNARSG